MYSQVPFFCCTSSQGTFIILFIHILLILTDSFITTGMNEEKMRQKRSFKLALSSPQCKQNLSKLKSSEVLMEKLIMEAHSWPKFY